MPFLQVITIVFLFFIPFALVPASSGFPIASTARYIKPLERDSLPAPIQDVPIHPRDVQQGKPGHPPSLRLFQYDELVTRTIHGDISPRMNHLPIGFASPVDMRASMSPNAFYAGLTGSNVQQSRSRFLDAAIKLQRQTAEGYKLLNFIGPLSRADTEKKADLDWSAEHVMRHRDEYIQFARQIEALIDEKVVKMNRVNRKSEAMGYDNAGKAFLRGYERYRSLLKVVHDRNAANQLRGLGRVLHSNSGNDISPRAAMSPAEVEEARRSFRSNANRHRAMLYTNRDTVANKDSNEHKANYQRLKQLASEVTKDKGNQIAEQGRIKAGWNEKVADLRAGGKHFSAFKLGFDAKRYAHFWGKNFAFLNKIGEHSKQQRSIENHLNVGNICNGSGHDANNDSLVRRSKLDLIGETDTRNTVKLQRDVNDPPLSSDSFDEEFFPRETRILPRVLMKSKDIEKAIKSYNRRAKEVKQMRARHEAILQNKESKVLRHINQNRALSRTARQVVADERKQFAEQQERRDVAFNNISWLRSHDRHDDADNLEEAATHYLEQWNKNYDLLRQLDRENQAKKLQSSNHRRSLRRRTEHKLFPRVLTSEEDFRRAMITYRASIQQHYNMMFEHQQTVLNHKSGDEGDKQRHEKLLKLAADVVQNKPNQLNEQERLAGVAVNNVNWLHRHGQGVAGDAMSRQASEYFEVLRNHNDLLYKINKESKTNRQETNRQKKKMREEQRNKEPSPRGDRPGPSTSYR